MTAPAIDPTMEADPPQAQQPTIGAPNVADSGPGPRPPASKIMETLRRSIDNLEPESVREAYLQSIGLTRDQWLAVANAYHGSKDDSVSQLPDNVDVTTGSPMKWRMALSSIPESKTAPAERLVMLQKLVQQAGGDPSTVQPYGRDNFVYMGADGKPLLFNEVRRLMGVPVPSLRDVVAAIPGIAHTAGQMIGGGLAAASAMPTMAAGPEIGIPAVGLAAGAGGAAGSTAAGAPVDAIFRALSGASGQGTKQDLKDQLDAAVGHSVNEMGARALMASAPALAKMLGIVPFDEAATSTTSKEMLDASGRLRVPLPLGTQIQSKGLMAIENSLRQNPAGMGVMARADATTFSAANRAAKGVASAFAGGSTPVAWENFGPLQQGVGKDYLARFAATEQGMDDAMMQAIKASPKTAGGLVPITQLEAQAKSLIDAAIVPAPGVAAAASNTQLSRIKPVLDAITDLQRTAAANEQRGLGRVVPFQDLLTERRNLFQQTGLTATVPYLDEQKQAFQSMWAAARQDIRDGSALAGPDAAELNRLHDEYVTRAMDDKNFVNFQTFKDWSQISGGRTPTELATSLLASKDPAAAVRQLRGAMRPGQWDAVTGSLIQDLGRSKGSAQSAASSLGMSSDEVWSPTVFRANLDKLKPVLGEWMGNTPYKDALQGGKDLATLADGLEASFKSYGRSQTATSMQGSHYIQSMTALPIAVLVGLKTGSEMDAAEVFAGLNIAPWVAAKMMTNPNINRVLASFGTGVQSGLQKVGADKAADVLGREGPKLAARMWSLTHIQPGMKPAIQDYMNALTTAGFPGATTEDPASKLNKPGVSFQSRP